MQFDKKVKYVLGIALSLFVLSVINTFINLHGSDFCRENDCLGTILLSIAYSLIYYSALSFAIISTFSHAKKSWLPAGLALSGASVLYGAYTYFYYFSQDYSYLFYFGFLLNMGIFSWVLAKAFNKTSKVKPVYILLCFLAFFLFSTWYAIVHMSDGGCDGGTCTIKVIFIPIYLLVYILLFTSFTTAKSEKLYKNIIGFCCCLIAFTISFSISSEFNGLARSDEWARYYILATPLSFAFVIAYIIHFFKKYLTASKSINL